MKKTESLGKDSHILLEQMNGNIDRLIDGQVDLSEKVGLINDRVGGLEIEMREGFIGVWKEIGSFKDETRANFKELFQFRDETRANFKELFQFRDETRANFKQIFDYLSSLDDELRDIKAQMKQFDETKIDRHKFNSLENRVIKLERELEECKSLVRERK